MHKGGLGGPGEVQGESWGSLGAPRGPFGSSGVPLRIRVAALEGPWGALGASINRPGAFLLRFLSAKYTYFQGFEHVNFVNLMWPLGAPERSQEGSGWPWELQSTLWGPPGGSRKRAFGLQGASNGQKTRFWTACRFPRSAPDLTFIVVLAIL